MGGQPLRCVKGMLDLTQIKQQIMQTEPYRWAFLNGLFSAADAAELSTTFPRDRFKTVAGFDGEKSYRYRSRSLVHMGTTSHTDPEGLSPAWQQLAADLLSPEYRSAVEALSGLTLEQSPMEVNVLHYGPGAWLGPHLDLKAKMITHVLYFNQNWDYKDGGNLAILRSSDPADIVAEVLPVVGNSSLLVRSDRSWHTVSRVAEECDTSRRSMNVIFHLPDSVSTMWPPGQNPVLEMYTGG